jgi:hypothetical protein
LVRFRQEKEGLATRLPYTVSKRRRIHRPTKQHILQYVSIIEYKHETIE